MKETLSSAHHHKAFLSFMQEQYPEVWPTYVELQKGTLTGKTLSQALIDTAIVCEAYISAFISDQKGLSTIKEALDAEKIVIQAKADFTKKH